MPKRTDIKSILLIGSGPIIIGQSCEFDYSGSQACKALLEEGYRVLLVNSNPATIMTDPDYASITYIEPLEFNSLVEIIKKEKPDAILSTLGGQTALNLSLELHKKGVLNEHNIELIGANVETINKAENRDEFRNVLRSLNFNFPEAATVYSKEEFQLASKNIGFPIFVRNSFALSGKGGRIINDTAELDVYIENLNRGNEFELSVEKSIFGWEEFELELMRDKADNVLVVCGMENFDPVGVHTGDSIAVAPIQTLSNKEYQEMRSMAIAIMRAVGVETGGANIQFAVHPKTREIQVIEINPRVSRSSALASKATGFPIARFAAKLAVGYNLTELTNAITGKLACYEPTLDYCVVKLPKFCFDTFSNANSELGVSMKAIGEVMAIGLSFREALIKGLRSLELKPSQLVSYFKSKELEEKEWLNLLTKPSPQRILLLIQAIKSGIDLNKIPEIHFWFLNEIQTLISHLNLELSSENYLQLKKDGFSDSFLEEFYSKSAFQEIDKSSTIPAFRSVDTCSGEFEAFTPYYYSSFGVESDEIKLNQKKEKVIVVGSGANRIGQGVEFDYACVQAIKALRAVGYEAVLINCNPETVSTDYDESDLLFFEPIDFESVYQICKRLKPKGVLLQFGGQSSLALADKLEEAGIPLLGIRKDEIELFENRALFEKFAKENSIPIVESKVINKIDQITKFNDLQFPALMRPSFVLGGTKMTLIYGQDELNQYLKKLPKVCFPVLASKYLDQAKEVDVDLIGDGKAYVICGLLENVEEAGVHSGDSMAILPPYSLSTHEVELIELLSLKIAASFKLVGPLNIQFLLHSGKVEVLEVNPRSSRTLPFISKASGIPWIKLASKAIVGELDLGEHKNKDIESFKFNINSYSKFYVKQIVFPFDRLDGAIIKTGSVMRSTGEVMGSNKNLINAWYKSQIAAGIKMPKNAKRIAFEPGLGLNSAYLKYIRDLSFEIIQLKESEIDLNGESVFSFDFYFANNKLTDSDTNSALFWTNMRQAVLRQKIAIFFSIRQLYFLIHFNRILN